MKKLLFLACLLVLPVVSMAKVHRCQVNGKMVFQQQPCAGDSDLKCDKDILFYEKAVKTKKPRSKDKVCLAKLLDDEKQKRLEKKRKSHALSDGWLVYRGKDEMTDEDICVLTSDSFSSKNILESEVQLRIFLKLGMPVVFIYMADEHKIFHNDIEGSGIRIDANTFIPVDSNGGQRIVLWHLEKSKKIISQLKSGNEVKLRFRVWPYDESHTTYPKKVSNFNEKLQELYKCEK